MCDLNKNSNFNQINHKNNSFNSFITNKKYLNVQNHKKSIHLKRNNYNDQKKWLNTFRWFHRHTITAMAMGVVVVGLIVYQWWRDVVWERTFQGCHTLKETGGLRWGMLLFIVSEILFFLSFFWAFFHRSLAPTLEIGGSWPPWGSNPLIPFKSPCSILQFFGFYL